MSKTNVEFVTELMEFSNHGALSQVFIIEAIRRYAEACSERRISDNGFISPDAWQGVAREIRDKLVAAGY